MKRSVVLILVLLVAVGAGVLYKRHMDAVPPVQAISSDAQAVSVQPVRVAPMVESVASYGNLVSDRSVNIVAQTPGVVRQILFDDGQAVVAGAPLVVMDAGIAEAQLQSSRAQADADVQNLRRTQSLSRQGLDSTYSTEQAQSRASASQAEVKINETKLAQLTLRAPFAGTLGSSRIDVGAFVTSADTIVQLQDTSELEIEFRMPSVVALQVAAGMPVHIQVPGTGADQMVDGRLSFIDPAISTDTRSVLLRAVVHNIGKHLRPGLYVRVSLDLRTHPAALVVPAGAISNDLNASYVFVVDDKNIARQRVVTIGLSDGQQTELLSGVKAGEQVVTIGQFRLRDGDPVKIVAPPADVKSAT
ncbi:MAG: efflux RND transporter periplasmic adaptor subunit [Acetobacteraceae bacterium]|nr:efflux RND transporter periplasmic adaptor subunit [Acetobacteraceae bacterium]